jgi:hypothetical protein
MQILNINVLIAGKFLNGYFVTVLLMATVKMINETIPVYLLGKYGAVINITGALGYFLVFGMGAGLPSHDYNPGIEGDTFNDEAKQADINDQFWRLLYGFPILVNGWMLLGFFLFIKEDSIMYNLSVDNEEGALQLIKRVYHEDEDYNLVL